MLPGAKRKLIDQGSCSAVPQFGVAAGPFILAAQIPCLRTLTLITRREVSFGIKRGYRVALKIGMLSERSYFWDAHRFVYSPQGVRIGMMEVSLVRSSDDLTTASRARDV
jgi:hypothetical protein